MRKGILLILLLLFVFSAFSCVPIEKISIDSDETVETTKPIISAELDQFLQDQQDFLLLVSLETCSSCQDFAPMLDEIIILYQIQVYQIESGEAFPTDNEWLPYNFTPTFMIVKDGEIISQIDAVNHEDEFSSVEFFTKYLEKYVNMTEK